MHLSKEVLRSCIVEKKLITDFFDVEGQLTANGFDARLAAVVEVLDGGRLAINKKENRAPTLGKAFVLKGFEDRLEGYDFTEKVVLNSGFVKLNALRPYLVITCEKINAPTDLMFHITSRSSLFRFTQSILGYGFGEAGYSGFLAFLLFAALDSEVELGVRFAQLSFSELRGHAHYQDQKECNQQGGKLF